jgi:hypothetical protein
LCVGGEYLGHLGGLFDFEYGLFSRLIVLIALILIALILIALIVLVLILRLSRTKWSGVSISSDQFSSGGVLSIWYYQLMHRAPVLSTTNSSLVEYLVIELDASIVLLVLVV